MAAMGMITAGICDPRNGGLEVKLHSSKLGPRMSQLVTRSNHDVRFTPKSGHR